jgi:hypothetical protein
MKADDPVIEFEPTVVPPGSCNSVTVPVLASAGDMVSLVNTFSPAVPVKVTTPCWPGAVSDSDAAVPSTVVVPVTVGALVTVTLADPVYPMSSNVVWSTWVSWVSFTLYVPAAGSVIVSTAICEPLS